METQVKQKNKALPVALGTGLMVAAGSAFAEGGNLGADAVAAIKESSGTLQTVGVALVTIIAGIWVIKRVVALIR